MRSRVVVLLLLCSIWITPPVGLAQPPEGVNSSSQSRSQSSQKHAGLFDYALSRINSDQRDYGAEVASRRRLLVLLTVQNIYFWFTIGTVALLTGVTVMHVLHLRADQKKEFLAARLITELWNGRVSDRIEIERRTELYNRLVAQKNAAVETSHDREREAVDAEENAESRTHKKIDRLVSGARPGTRGQVAKANATDTPLGVPTATDLTQQNMLLERRIEAMRNTEQNLRERLNQTASQLDDERKRNRALKGA